MLNAVGSKFHDVGVASSEISVDVLTNDLSTGPCEVGGVGSDSLFCVEIGVDSINVFSICQAIGDVINLDALHVVLGSVRSNQELVTCILEDLHTVAKELGIGIEHVALRHTTVGSNWELIELARF